MTVIKPTSGNMVQVRIGNRLRSGKVVAVTPCCYRVLIGSRLVSVRRRDLVVVQDDDSDCE